MTPLQASQKLNESELYIKIGDKRKEKKPNFKVLLSRICFVLNTFDKRETTN